MYVNLPVASFFYSSYINFLHIDIGSGGARTKASHI